MAVGLRAYVSLNVATGRIEQATRTEQDLDTHLRALLAQSPEATKIHWVIEME
ncbi:MAG: hypothetical protein AAFX78_18320 [Cyanobacteria bacterium J06638_20]